MAEISTTPGPPMTSAKMISGAQVRAARALLDWTVRDLARLAIVSVAAVNTIEEARQIPNKMTAKLESIRKTLERAGIEFLDGDAPGVRLHAKRRR
jgi:transcriptional regulator with XRE-family HTH domain